MKRFEYLPLGKELKAQTDIAKKQYLKLDITYESEKIIKKEKPTLEKYDRSNLIHDSKYSFYPYYNITNFNSLFLISKYPALFSFYSELNKLNPYLTCISLNWHSLSSIYPQIMLIKLMNFP